MYDLLINLLNENESILDSSVMQVYLAKIIFTAHSSVLINLNELVEKRNDIINQFSEGNIITKNEKFFDTPRKITESVTKQKSEEESDQSIPNWVKMSEERFNSIKQSINKKKKDLGSTIDNKRYTLNHVNDLVNKRAKKRLARITPLNFTAN